MIVRISGEDQFRLDDEQRSQVEELERRVLGIVESGQEDGFGDALARCSSSCATHGERLGDDELVGSDVILPPADASFQEAAREFTGEGLIPD